MNIPLLIIIIIVAILMTGIWQIINARSFQVFGELIARVETDKKILALTFDDGPWATKYTNEVIDTLNDLNIKGTFFLNGIGIEKNPEAAQNLVTAGHEIGNHSYSHKRMVFMGMRQIREEVESTTKLIRTIGYEGKIFFRPPFGKKLFTLPFYLGQNNILSVAWDIEPETYRKVRITPDSMANYVVSKVKPGSIIVLHVLGKKNKVSRDSIRLIVEGLQAKGFQFIKLSELINLNACQSRNNNP